MNPDPSQNGVASRYKKGEGGAMPGNHNAARGSAFRNAIKKALAELGGDYEAGVLRIANKLVAMADSSDIAAIREIADRLDGKPAQDVNANINAGEGLLAVLAALSRRNDP